jgi:hypothetical protein
LNHLPKFGIWGNRSGRSLSTKPLLWVIVGMSASLIFFMTSVYGFLAVNHPEGEGILVVEGWIPAETLAESVHVFNSGSYQYLVVVGGPIQGTGSVFGRPTTYADLAASRLEQHGFDTKKLIKINVPAVSSERTLTGAAYVKRWIERSGTNVCCVDVFTTGVHARRSWTLSQYALGNSYRVGIIAGPEARFDPKYWFVSRSGSWLVVRNLAGCVYYKVWIFCHMFLPETQRSFPGAMTDFQDGQPIPADLQASLPIKVLKYPDYLSEDVKLGLSSSRIVLRKSVFDEVGAFATPLLQLFTWTASILF